MKNRIIALIAIIMLFAPAACMAASGGTGAATGILGFAKKHPPLDKVYDFLRHANFEHTKLILYLTLLGFFINGVTTDIALNLRDYILMNPSPTEPEVLNVMNFFISLLQGVYVLAIGATAFYIMFFSISPKQRANAKYMLGKLIIGVLLISISPFIIKLLFDFSYSMTEQILDQTDTDAAVEQYNDVLWKSYWLSVLTISAPVILDEGIREYAILPILKDRRLKGMAKARGIELDAGWMGKLESVVEGEVRSSTYGTYAGYTGGFVREDIMDEVEKTVKEGTKASMSRSKWGVEDILHRLKLLPKPDFTFPFLMTQMLFIFGLYGMLALRYLMMMLWTILFPFTIFFTTFELTKGLGRNMIEQTIFWTVVQVFFALSVATISAGFAILPEGFEYFSVGLPAPFEFLAISIFSLAACGLLILSPILLLILSQRLLAP